jgi:hypothetical protein
MLPIRLWAKHLISGEWQLSHLQFGVIIPALPMLSPRYSRTQLLYCDSYESSQEDYYNLA